MICFVFRKKRLQRFWKWNTYVQIDDRRMEIIQTEGTAKKSCLKARIMQLHMESIAEFIQGDVRRCFTSVFCCVEPKEGGGETPTNINK